MTTLTKENGLVLQNYKEPLKKVAQPFFGYQGAILVTPDGEKMQCHMCGELFANVGFHAYMKHKIKIKDYKEKFSLAQKSSLVSEQERERMKVKSLRWWQNLSLTEKTKAKAKFQSSGRYSGKRHKARGKDSLESQNLKGTCPDQIADYIQECAKAIGKTPSMSEFIDWSGSQRFVRLAKYRFGSWNKALEHAKLEKSTHRKGGGAKRRSNEELLDMLLVFWQETGRVPSYTDCRRGLLPPPMTITRRFGSLANARKLAGITDEMDTSKFKTPFGELVKTGYKTNV